MIKKEMGRRRMIGKRDLKKSWMDVTLKTHVVKSVKTPFGLLYSRVSSGCGKTSRVTVLSYTEGIMRLDNI